MVMWWRGASEDYCSGGCSPLSLSSPTVEIIDWPNPRLRPRDLRSHRVINNRRLRWENDGVPDWDLSLKNEIRIERFSPSSPSLGLGYER